MPVLAAEVAANGATSQWTFEMQRSSISGRRRPNVSRATPKTYKKCGMAVARTWQNSGIGTRDASLRRKNWTGWIPTRFTIPVEPICPVCGQPSAYIKTITVTAHRTGACKAVRRVVTTLTSSSTYRILSKL